MCIQLSCYNSTQPYNFQLIVARMSQLSSLLKHGYMLGMLGMLTRVLHYMKPWPGPAAVLACEVTEGEGGGGGATHEVIC